MNQQTTVPTDVTAVWPFIIYSGLAFGSAGLLSKGLIDGGVDSFTVTSFPFVAAGAFAWAVAWRAGQIRSSAFRAGALLGVVNSALPALCFNIALETLPAGLVTLILSLGPVITAALAHLVFTDERFSRKKGAGLALAVAGVAALIAAPGVIEGASYGGAAWATIGALLAGSSAILNRLYAVRHGALTIIPMQLSVAGIFPILAAGLFGRSLIPTGGFTGSDVIALGVIGLGAAYAGVRALMIANQRGTTGQVAMVSYLIPLVGVIGGIILFSEQLTIWIAAGGCLILLGITVGGRASAAIRA